MEAGAFFPAKGLTAILNLLYLVKIYLLVKNRQILKTLNIRPETSLLVLPVVMMNKVVAVVLVTADMDALGRRLNELQMLVRKASLAFEMLIIKNKILMT